MRAAKVLITPLVTEKGTLLGEKSRYLFKVNKSANKYDIKRAVEQTFKVDVIAVNTYIQRGKVKAFGRGKSKLPDIKKAIVSLKSGQKINLWGEV